MNGSQQMMTEQEWLACDDVDQLIDHHKETVSDRKWRLFACGCCRENWNWMTDRRSRQGVTVAEKLADKLIPDREADLAREGTAEAWTTVWGDGWHVYQTARAAHFSLSSNLDHVLLAPSETHNAWLNAVRDGIVRHPMEDVESQVKARQTSLLRDIVGNPFRPTTVEASWSTPTVVSFARVIYEQRTFEELPILADALEEAGCQNQEILQHCRSGELHVRGCWVLDLLLGKE